MKKIKKIWLLFAKGTFISIGIECIKQYEQLCSEILYILLGCWYHYLPHSYFGFKCTDPNFHTPFTSNRVDLFYIAKLVNTWSEIQNYTCKPVLLDSAQAICVKKSHLQLLAIVSLQYILLSTLSKMSKIMPKKHTFWLRNWFHWNQHTLIMLKFYLMAAMHKCLTYIQHDIEHSA